MPSHYMHLRIEDRVALMLMRQSGHSLRAIASALGRSPSTLSRELRRNRQHDAYCCSTAE